MFWAIKQKVSPIFNVEATNNAVQILSHLDILLKGPFSGLEVVKYTIIITASSLGKCSASVDGHIWNGSKLYSADKSYNFLPLSPRTEFDS